MGMLERTFVVDCVKVAVASAEQIAVDQVQTKLRMETYNVDGLTPFEVEQMLGPPQQSSRLQHEKAYATALDVDPGVEDGVFDYETA